MAGSKKEMKNEPRLAPLRVGQPFSWESKNLFKLNKILNGDLI